MQNNVSIILAILEEEAVLIDYAPNVNHRFGKEMCRQMQ